MSQEVYNFPKATIEKMKDYYQHALLKTPPGAVFRAKTKNASITAYKSGKVLFQGKNPNEEALKWEGNLLVHKNTTKIVEKKNNYIPSESLFISNHIGSDEAGTGDYFGPITVACDYVESSQIHELKQMGVKDSKNLSDKTIIQLANAIVTMDIPYTLLILHNKKYNKLQKQGWSQGKMKTMLHHHAIKNLLNKIGNAPLKGILIDQFCSPDVYKRHLNSENQRIHENTYFMTKAESASIAVATGSIIARASFVKEMNNLSDKMGFTLPKGASKHVDKTIAGVIKEKGQDTLMDCAKIHFANTQKAKQYL